jgi:hypothetical protein
LAALSAALLLLCLSDGPGWHYGYTYRGDEWMILVQMQALQETGDPLCPSRLAAPWGADWHSFPMRTPIECLWARCAFLTGCNAFEALSIVWVAMTGLTGMTAYLAFRELDFERPRAYLLAVAFALQSYTWEHNIWHLHCYFAWVPGQCLVLLGLSQGRALSRWLWLNAFLAGLSSIYYNFFQLWLLPVALLLGWPKADGEARHSWRCMGLAWALGLGLHVGQIAYRPAAPPTAAPAQRSLLTSNDPSQAEMYSLQLRHLLCPRPNHPFPPLAALEGKLDAYFQATRPWSERHQSEATRGRLNSLASIGLLLCALCLWRGPHHSQEQWPYRAAQFCALILLIASTGGLGPVFNAIFFERLRCYNRIQVFLCFYCLALAGRFLPRRPWVILLLPFLLIDQFQPVSAYQPQPFPGVAQLYQHDRAFVADLESKLPPAAKVFQLPFHRAFSQPDVQWHGEYQSAMPYLFSKKLSWSWGYLQDASGDWHLQIQELPLVDLLQAVKAKGFQALWWDRYGYRDDPKALRINLPRYLGPPLLVSPNGRYHVFSLDKPIPVLDPEQADATQIPHQIEETDYPQFLLEKVSWPEQDRWYRRTVREVQVRLSNQSSKLICSKFEPALHLCYHWADSQGQPVIYDGWRSDIPPLLPGDSLVIPLRVLTPEQPGQYQLQVRLVHESRRWIEKGGLDLEVVIPY